MTSRLMAGPESRLRSGLKLSLLDAMVSAPLIYLASPNNYLIAALLTKVFAISEGNFGLIISLPFWCNVGQLVFIPLLFRNLLAKHVAILSGGIHLLMWLFLAYILAWIPRANTSASTDIFISFFFLSYLLQSLNVVAWNSWNQEWTPEKIRGRYFGQRNRIIQVVTLLFLLVVGVILDRSSLALRTFQILIVGATILRATGMLAQYRIQAPILSSATADHSGLLGQFKIIVRSRAFILFNFFGAIWGFASNSFGPFYVLYMYKQMSFSTTHVSILVVLMSVCSSLSLPTWGILLDRFGNKPVMITSLVLWQIQNYLWYVITPATAWMLYLMCIWAGYISAGFLLGLFNLLLKLAPSGATTLAIAINLATGSLFMAVGVIFGGSVLSHATAFGLTAVSTYHLAFIFQPTVALLSCFILLQVEEPKASSLRPVVMNLLTLRTASGLLGLALLYEWVGPSSFRKCPPS